MSDRHTILVVDDDPSNIKVITAALKDEFDIVSALNGHDAIDQLKAHRPDLILLDVMMPDMSGFDVCCIIKSDVGFADIPVIFLTAVDTQEGELQGLEVGGIDYLTKPVNLALLKLRVRNHLLLKKQQDLLKQKNAELEAALERVKQLEGIIPICSYCKKIRDDQQTWQQLETYISNHSEAVFSHGMCPECATEQMKIIAKMKVV
ncbi:MAG TPA: response regulator [Desulfuromonadales bacterium]|nr:response regulator [Desulfuromonadales bacterium]